MMNLSMCLVSLVTIGCKNVIPVGIYLKNGVLPMLRSSSLAPMPKRAGAFASQTIAIWVFFSLLIVCNGIHCYTWQIIAYGKRT